ncbi:hypothetical protein WP8W18C01_28620 [Pseudomonas putida]|uniref:Uncharacterized protein n=1 Tax=Pseudomonas putida TaxID=303 RepID=A0A6S5TBG5_PSEPU|nr:hypothetical protein WP4W18C03_20550 [Pseudomonas putida]BBT40521.1 hypothetical protein WP8W18C01_28620 [Pseudomonas putida]CAB5565498.1 Uncharacterised protein [Pseudomonas putida]
MGTFFTLTGNRRHAALCRAGVDRHDLPSAMQGFLRHGRAPAQVTLPRLPACVAAKQNGFWQIVA